MTRYEQLEQIKKSLYEQAINTTFLIAKQCFYNASTEIDKLMKSLSIEQAQEII